MSTSRAFKPILGSGHRLILDQLVSHSTRSHAPGKLFLSRSLSLVCPSCCRHGFVLNLNLNLNLTQQLRFSSSSTPPKPPGSSNDNSNNAVPDQHDPASSSSPSSVEPGPTQQQQQPSEEKNTKKHNKISDLPSTQNSRRSSLNRKLSAFMDRAQTTLFAASQRINDLTGYSGIESLKTQISAVEANLAAAQAALHAARVAYKTAVSSRSATQREVTTLLARQKTWTPPDFERFTALYRQDYELEAAVVARAAELEDAEREAERLGRELSAGILSRYHEEQIWSDKIRRMSTWGTWGLMGVNVLLFLIFQFGAEPWRRRRLVRGFEEKVREALDDERLQRELADGERRKRKAEDKEEEAAAVAAAASTIIPDVDTAAGTPGVAEVVGGEQAGLAADVDQAAVADEPVKFPWREAFSDPERLKATFNDLSSDRKVAIRMRDVSIIALEGAAAGAAVAGAIAVFFIRRT
ncbi:Mdm33 family-domain-containing protein [Hypoxylon crocopeplum]|nr:Mdm33 family-domain-containing protein [Hypoxylon crocopeplum]